MTSRPLSGERAGSGRPRRHRRRTSRAATVTVDDAALFTARFADGAIGSFEATRFALGRKNALRIEINGTAGSVAFDFEDSNVLQFFDGTRPARGAGIPPDRGHRARPPVRGCVVAARPRPRLRARLHPPGRRPGQRHRRPPSSRPRPSPTRLQVQRVPGRGRGQRANALRLDRRSSLRNSNDRTSQPSRVRSVRPSTQRCRLPAGQPGSSRRVCGPSGAG